MYLSTSVALKEHLEDLFAIQFLTDGLPSLHGFLHDLKLVLTHPFALQEAWHSFKIFVRAMCT